MRCKIGRPFILTGQVLIRANSASLRRTATQISQAFGGRGGGVVGGAVGGGVSGGGIGGGGAIIAARSANQAAEATTKWGNAQKFTNRHMLSGRRQASTMFRDIATLTAGILSLRSAFLALGAGVKEGLTFEKQIVAIKQIVTQSSGAIKGLTDQVRALSKEFGLNTAILNQNAIELLQSGRSISDVRKALPTLALLGKNAQVGAEGLAQASKAIIVWGNVFDQTTEQATRSFAKVVALAKTQFITAGEIVEASTIMASSAKIMGVSFDEMLAIVAATKSAVGRPVSETARGLNTFFSRITTGLAIGKLSKLGIEIFDTQENFRGLIPVLTDINKAFDKFGEGTKKAQALLQILGGVRRKGIAGGAANALEQIKINLELLGQDFTGVLERDAEIALDTIVSKLSEVGVAFTDLFKNISDSPFGTLTKQVLDMTKALLESKDVLAEIAALLAVAGGVKFLGRNAAVVAAATLKAGGVAVGAGTFVGRKGKVRERRLQGFGGDARRADRGGIIPITAKQPLNVRRAITLGLTPGQDFTGRLPSEGILAVRDARNRSAQVAQMRRARTFNALGGRTGIGFGGGLVAGMISSGFQDTETRGGALAGAGFQGLSFGLLAFGLGLSPATAALVGITTAAIATSNALEDLRIASITRGSKEQRKAIIRSVEDVGLLDPKTLSAIVTRINTLIIGEAKARQAPSLQISAEISHAFGNMIEGLRALAVGEEAEFTSAGAVDTAARKRAADAFLTDAEKSRGLVEQFAKAFVESGAVIEEFDTWRDGFMLKIEILDDMTDDGMINLTSKLRKRLKEELEALGQTSFKQSFPGKNIGAMATPSGEFGLSVFRLERQAARMQATRKTGISAERFGTQRFGTRGFARAAEQLPISRKDVLQLQSANKAFEIIRMMVTNFDFGAETFKTVITETLSAKGVGEGAIERVKTQMETFDTFKEFTEALKDPTKLLNFLSEELQPLAEASRKLTDELNNNARELTAQFGQFLQRRGAIQGVRATAEATRFNLAQMKAGFRGKTLRPGASVELLRRQVGSTIGGETRRLANAEAMLRKTKDERWAMVITDSISKLQQLGNAAARTGSILDNLNREEASRAGKLGNVEAFLFATGEERRGMLQNEFAALQAIKQGDIGGFTEIEKQQAIAGLRQRGEIIAREQGQFQGDTGNQIADALLAKLFGMDRGPEAKNIAQLQNHAANQLIAAARAQEIAANAMLRMAQRVEGQLPNGQQPIGQIPLQQFQPLPLQQQFPNPQFRPSHLPPPPPEVIPQIEKPQPDEVKISVNVGGIVEVKGINSEGLGDAISNVAISAVRNHLLDVSKNMDDLGPQSMRTTLRPSNNRQIRTETLRP